ncbi:hypothetical protein BH23THE1_BH23THE1_35380 [soil metagenome]
MLNTGTEHLQNTLVVICICTFLVYHPIMSLKRGPFYSSCSLQVKKSHVAIWKWIQKYHPKKILSKRKRISEFIVDETLVKVGSEYI